MEVLNNKYHNDQFKISIINKINILIEKIDNLEFNDNLSKIQQNYIVMLGNTKTILEHMKGQIEVYQNYNSINKYIKNKNDELNEFLINVKRFNSNT